MAERNDNDLLALLFGGAQGLTFGFGDEAVGLVSPEAAEYYDKVLEDNPVSALSGEVATGFVPFIGWGGRALAAGRMANRLSKGGSLLGAPKRALAPIAGKLKGSGTLGRLAEKGTKKVADVTEKATGFRPGGVTGALAGGGAYGGLYGLGEGEGGIDDRLAGAATGAGVGAALGGVSGVALRKLLGSQDTVARHQLRKANAPFDVVDPAIPLPLQYTANRKVLSDIAKSHGDKPFPAPIWGTEPVGVLGKIKKTDKDKANIVSVVDELEEAKRKATSGEAGSIFSALDEVDEINLPPDFVIGGKRTAKGSEGSVSTAKDVEEGYGASGIIDALTSGYQRVVTQKGTRRKKLNILLGETGKGGAAGDAVVPNPVLHDNFSPTVDIFRTSGWTLPSKTLPVGSEEADEPTDEEKARMRKIGLLGH